MSAGLSLITALISTGDRSVMRHLRDEYFTADEGQAWTFLQDHYARYGEVPSAAVFAENGINLSPSTSTLDYHLHWVRHRAVYNAIRGAHGPLMDALQANDMDAAVEAMGEMQQAVSRVRGMESVQGRQEWASGVVARYDAMQAEEEQQGITMGWRLLDLWTGRIQRGDVVAIVGRPGDGKTYTISHMALSAWRAGHRVLLVTMEMTDEQIATRLMGLEMAMDPAYIRRGNLSTFAHDTFMEAVQTFTSEDGAEFFIAGGDMHKGVRDIDSMVQELRPDIVYIDASYLLRPEEARNRSRWEMLADVGEGIKAMALRRDVGVVHSVQFNRQAKAKTKGDHDLGMIGGTDVIGQVASIVIGIRPGVTPHERTRRRFSLIKNREGQLGNFTTNFLFQPIDFTTIGEDGPSQVTEDEARQSAESMQALEESML